MCGTVDASPAFGRCVLGMHPDPGSRGGRFPGLHSTGPPSVAWPRRYAAVRCPNLRRSSRPWCSLSRYQRVRRRNPSVMAALPSIKSRPRTQSGPFEPISPGRGSRAGRSPSPIGTWVGPSHRRRAAGAGVALTVPTPQPSTGALL
jgi:hypothetical protein